MMMYLHYDKKDKRKFLLFNALILVSIILMGYIAFKSSNVSIPSFEEKLKVGAGFALILIIVLLAMFNVINVLFKFKSILFLILTGIFYFFSTVIDLLFVTTALVSIPLLVNDIIVRPYFHYLNNTKYFERYKYIGSHNGKV